MKKIILCLLMLLFVFVPYSGANADVIAPGKKVVSVCYKIINVDEYSDYKFQQVSYFLGKRTQSFSDIVVLNSNSCIGDGVYKFFNIEVYAEKDNKEYNLINLDVSSWAGIEVDEKNNLESKEVDYKIGQIIGNKIYLYKSADITRYTNAEDVINTYKNPYAGVYEKIKSFVDIFKYRNIIFSSWALYGVKK